MKTLKSIMTLILLITAASAYSQTMHGEIRGRIIDSLTHEPVPYVVVGALINDKVMASTTSNENGYYSLKPLSAGEYTLKTSSMGYHSYTMVKTKVNSASLTTVNFTIATTTIELPGPTVSIYVNPLIPNTGAGLILETKDIENMPYTSAIDMAATTAGVIQSDQGGSLNIRGSRADGTQYIIDGVKVSGPFNIPKSAIKEIKVLTGGIPAMFGDATGGIVIITTKGYTNW